MACMRCSNSWSVIGIVSTLFSALGHKFRSDKMPKRTPDVVYLGVSAWSVGVAMTAVQLAPVHRGEQGAGVKLCKSFIITESPSGFLRFGRGPGTVVSYEDIHRRIQNFPSCATPYQAYTNAVLIARHLCCSCESCQQSVGAIQDLAYWSIKSWFLEHNRRAKAAETACQELLQSQLKTEKHKATESKDTANECIICMSEERSHVYKPCGHRVCCGDCAEQFWQRRKECPWCSAPCEEP